MAQSLLLIPIHINALHLKEGRIAVEPMVNFSRLPYFDGKRDVNRNFGNISELLIAAPFQNRNLYLPPGIHLHWELPQTLSNGIPKDKGSLEFPTVPNRWLVIRKRKQTNTETWKVENTWIVESDYLWGIGKDSKSVTIPFPINQKEQKYQPFRYLGRQLSLKSWLEQSDGKYWGKSLTAVGYGEPTFAAFYPNCYSVFGCYDSEVTEVDNSLSYDVFGWYSNKKYDYLNIYLQELKNEVKKIDLLDNDKLLAEFQEKLKWKITKEEFEQLQKQEKNNADEIQILCYGSLRFQPQETSSKAALDITRVVLANSGTEALSSYLAAEVASTTKVGKRTLENLLEALQLATNLEDEQLDLESKLQDARHEKGFTATSADLLWIIEQVNQKSQNTQQKPPQTSQINLPENIAGLLLEINQLQKRYNRAKHEIESRREQLFADWYKYILCSYPPIGKITEYPNPNLVRNFLTNQGVEPLQRQVLEVGDLLLGTNHSEELEVAISRDSNNNSLAAQIANKFKALTDEIKKNNNEVKKLGVSYRVKAIPSPRYWQPNEPVVMIIGDITKSTSTNQKTNNLLDCYLWQDPNSDVLSLIGKDNALKNIEDSIQALLKKVEQLITQNKQWLTIWSEQPWQPFLLEWEAGINTVQNEIGNRSYPNNFILQNCRVMQDMVELERISIYQGKNSTDVYSGHNILTPYAALQQENKLKEYFQKQPIFDKYCKSKNINKLSWDWLNNEDLCQWLELQKDIIEKLKDIYIALVKVYQKLQATKCLSQCLGGLNPALLGRKQTLQLNIDDPIGFSNYQPFVEGVAQAIQQSISSAPQPLNFFNPIRVGSLKIQRLRLVDTFGTTRDVPLTETIITPEYLKAFGNDPNTIALPPRLVQPARISFRWLSGNPQYQGESGSHPSLGPICGWILSDRIDKTIEIYNAQGRSLGELEVRKVGEQRWRPAPGSSEAVRSIADIPNPYLKKVVEYLDRKTDTFLEQFVLGLSKAWENIEPNNFDSSPSIALLMGQPMAIVRASINLELQGLPAINQDWDMFRQDLGRNTREDNGFPGVNFPLRLGDYRRKGDGLIGYWLETQSGNLSNSVYIPQAKLPEKQNQELEIVTRLELINQSIQAEPQIVTMLIDPRTSIHLISGILPTKAINVSSEHYVDALNAIETTFLTTPILTSGKMYLPLLEEQDYSWSWLEKETINNNDNWSEISSIGKIEESKFIEAIRQQIPDLDAQATWNYLLKADVGWLTESVTQGFKSVSPFEKRIKKELDQPYKNKQKQIDFILDLCTIKIRPTSIEATFAPQEIREGWLKLKKVNQNQK